MKNRIILCVICLICLVCLIFNTGCASYLSYNASKKEIIAKKSKYSTSAIKPYINNDVVGVGVNLLDMEAIKQHPFRQLGAAIIDAVIAYGAYEGINALNDIKKSNNDNIINEIQTYNVTINNDTTVEIVNDDVTITITTNKE